MPIALISTLDTKGREVAFLKSCLKELGRSVVVIDVGMAGPMELRRRFRVSRWPRPLAPISA